MYRREILMNLGISEYLLWCYLSERNFILPSIDELTKHFRRDRRTVKSWVKKLKESGYI
jgi:hypothetical protein